MRISFYLVFPILGACALACSSSDDSGSATSTGGSSATAGAAGHAGSASSTAGAANGGSSGGGGSSAGGGAGAAQGGSSASLGGTGGASAGTGGASSAAGSANGGAGGASGAAGAGGSSGGSSGFPDPSTFKCNALLGVSVTGDWFGAGFETGLPGDKWQLKWKTESFIEQWADPNNAVWSTAVISACADASASPDRVIFTAVNWTFTTEADWEAQLTKDVETFKAKYAAVKEIDLMTMLRAPNNQICGQAGQGSTNEQIVQPFVDQAMTAVGAKYPTLVKILPPFYAPSCAIFQPNSPHFADGQAAVVAKVYRDYFMNH